MSAPGGIREVECLMDFHSDASGSRGHRVVWQEDGASGSPEWAAYLATLLCGDPGPDRGYVFVPAVGFGYGPGRVPTAMQLVAASGR